MRYKIQLATGFTGKCIRKANIVKLQESIFNPAEVEDCNLMVKHLSYRCKRGNTLRHEISDGIFFDYIF